MTDTAVTGGPFSRGNKFEDENFEFGMPRWHDGHMVSCGFAFTRHIVSFFKGGSRARQKKRKQHVFLVGFPSIR